MRQKIRKKLQELNIENNYELDSVKFNGYYKVIINIYGWRPSKDAERIKQALNDYIVQFKKEDVHGAKETKVAS